MVMPVGDHDRIGCFADQVKPTHALVRDLDKAVKEVKLLGEHKEESRQKITELEALCKRLRKMLRSWERRRPPWKEWSSPMTSWLWRLPNRTTMMRIDRNRFKERSRDGPIFTAVGFATKIICCKQRVSSFIPDEGVVVTKWQGERHQNLEDFDSMSERSQNHNSV
jgi:hypothetical protein